MKNPPTELQSLEAILREPVRLNTVLQLCSEGVLFVEDGNHGENRPLADEFEADGTPFVRPDDLKGGRVDFLHCDRINDIALNRVRKGKGRGGDILFTHRATVGRMARTSASDPPFVANPGVTVWRSLAPQVLDTDFLYFFMHTPAFMNQVWAEAGNTDTFPYVSLTSQRGLWLALPSITKQRSIAGILGTLDDKIDLNRRMNETLEAMARAIFKDWFVDFGPTRAKIEGRAPYLAPEIWALFPGRLDNEGKPEGWNTKRIEDILELGYGKSLPAAKRVSGDVPVYGSGGIAGFHNEAALSAPSVIVGRKGSVGTVYWENQPCFPIDTVFYVIPRTAPLSFCFYLLSSLGLTEMNTDAAVPGLNRNNVYRLSGPWGDKTTVSFFNELVLPIRRRMSAAETENRTLAATRDLLLPKLMSGEIRVKDAEKAIEAVA